MHTRTRRDRCVRAVRRAGSLIDGDHMQRASLPEVGARQHKRRRPPVAVSWRQQQLFHSAYPCAILPPPRTVPELVVLVSTMGNRQLLL